MSNEIIVSQPVGLPLGPNNKTLLPCYLIKLLPEPGSKSKACRLFIAIEQPQFNSDFIHTKGFYSDATEADIVGRYREIVSQAPSTDILEEWMPWHTIFNVRSLVFKTQIKK